MASIYLKTGVYLLSYLAETSKWNYVLYNYTLLFFFQAIVHI